MFYDDKTSVVHHVYISQECDNKVSCILYPVFRPLWLCDVCVQVFVCVIIIIITNIARAPFLTRAHSAFSIIYIYNTKYTSAIDTLNQAHTRTHDTHTYVCSGLCVCVWCVCSGTYVCVMCVFRSLFVCDVCVQVCVYVCSSLCVCSGLCVCDVCVQVFVCV